MLIRLTEWVARTISPVPHKNTLVNWVKEGRIYPVPVFIGRSYYVEENARILTDRTAAPKRPDFKRSNRKLRLADRIAA